MFLEKIMKNKQIWEKKLPKNSQKIFFFPGKVLWPIVPAQPNVPKPNRGYILIELVKLYKTRKI